MSRAAPGSPLSVPSAWPALTALAVVVLMSLGMLGVDLVVDRQTASRTAELVDNSLRSIALADDLRYQAHRLLVSGLDADELSSIAKQIKLDAVAYEPLATSPGELPEWTNLRGLLAHLQHEQPLSSTGASAELVGGIESSIANLVRINQVDASRNVEAIADTHLDGLVIDGVVGLLTLAIAVAIAVVLVRALRRQRQLIGIHLESLDERNRELEAFAARTSHDLKGPLSPVRGYADILLANDQPEVREIASRIRRASDRMVGIIDDLLSLSVAGHPTPGTARIGPVVDEILHELEGELAGVRVTRQIEDCTAACSTGVLSQILRNIITNASKYRAPARPLALRIEARRIRDRIELVITDNGVGMTEAAAARAFEPYFRASSGVVAGHGLGLAIVKRAIDAIGGRCSMTSKSDEGTRVVIGLPATRV